MTRVTCSDCKRRLVIDSLTYCKPCDRIVCAPCDRANHAHASEARSAVTAAPGQFVCVRLRPGFTWCPDRRCPTRSAGEAIRRDEMAAHLRDAHPRLVRG